MACELLILRHGKSDWSTDHPDFERPLKDRGKRGAQRIGLWLRQQNLLPDRVLSSPAERAIVTAEKACKVMGWRAADIVQEQRVYGAGADQLIKLLRETPPGVERLMLVGHNPGLEELLIDLSEGPVPIPEDGKLLPTATLARLTLNCGWSDATPGCARLHSITRGAALPTKFPFPEHDSSELRDRPAYYYRQSSVIPYRRNRGALEILIVSSSKQKHWVVPKGIQEPGTTPQESAAIEAREEAGIEGEVGAQPLGSYRYQKWGAECRVEVYPMRVSRVIPEQEWEERHRGRRWVSIDKAGKLLRQSELKPLLQRLRETVA